MARWILPKADATYVPTVDDEGEIYYKTSDDTVYVVAVDGTEVTEVPLGGAGSIGLDQLPVADGANELLITDSSNAPVYVSAPAGTLVGRGSTGALEPQKLQASMVNDNTLPHAKLANLLEGQVLGALPADGGTPNTVAVRAINIADIVGVSVFSGDTAPENPKENDLWFYEGAHTDGETVEGDSARMYIRRANTWVDVSPPIYNLDPGPEGPQGADGQDGRSVANVRVQNRENDEDIVLEFLDQNSSVIAAVTIPINELAVDSGVPNIGEDLNGNYVLTTDNDDSTPNSWTQIETFSGQADAGLYTVPQRVDTDSSSRFLREDGTWVMPDDMQIADEDIQDIVGGMVDGNVETGITVSYDDGAGKLNFDVSTYGGDDSAAGLVPARDSGNTTTKFLREDGDWQVPAVAGDSIANDAITTDKIAADAVTQAKIADNAVGGDQIIDGQVGTSALADDAVTADKLADTAVTAGDYTLANITVDAQGRITAASDGMAAAYTLPVADGTTLGGIIETGGDIDIDAAGVVTLKSDSVSVTELNAGAVAPTDGELLAFDSNTGHLQWVNAGAAAGVNDSTITLGGDVTADSTFTLNQSANATVSLTLNSNSVGTDEIADDAVTAAKLADTSVTAGDYTLATISVDAQGRITAASDGVQVAAANDSTITFSGDITTQTITTNQAAASTIDISLSSDVVDATALNVSGDGTSGQLLSSDGDGSFSWTDAGAAPNDSTITFSGDIATQTITTNQAAASTIDISLSSDVVDATALNVSGDGTSGQLLASDGDGSFSWTDAGAAPNDSTITFSGDITTQTITTNQAADSTVDVSLTDGVVTYPKIDVTGTAGQVLTIDSAGTNWEWADAAAGGASITVGDTAPESPTEGDLWYYEGGDEAVGNIPQLYVYVTDSNNTSYWLASAPTPELPGAPSPAIATSYNLHVDGDILSWVEASDGGGGGGSYAAPTAYTTALGIGNSSPGVLTMDSAGKWRFRINNLGSGNRWVVCTSGFSNIAGGWYEFNSDTRVNEQTTFKNGMAEWDSTASPAGFKIHRWSDNLTSNSTTVNWNEEYSSGAITDQQSMSGAGGTTASAQLIRNVGWVKGELIITGPVTLTVYTVNNGGTPASSSLIRSSLNKIT